MKKVLVVAPTTEARVKGKRDIEQRWKDIDVQTASFEYAVGVCKEIVPCVVVVCPGAGGPVVYDQIKKMMPNQQIVRVGYDKLPATL